MITFTGSHKILRALRASDTAAITFFITLGAMFVGRHFFEGVPYQISYSAMIGDTAGFIYILLRAQEILRRPEIHIPDWLQRNDVHIVTLGVSFLLGVIVCLLSLQARQGQVMDAYHDIVIAPMFLYLAITLIPVILYNGTRREMFEVGFYACLWLLLAILDWETGMIAQRVWLAGHIGVDWPVLWSVIPWHQ